MEIETINLITNLLLVTQIMREYLFIRPWSLNINNLKTYELSQESFVSSKFWKTIKHHHHQPCSVESIYCWSFGLQEMFIFMIYFDQTWMCRSVNNDYNNDIWASPFVIIVQKSEISSEIIRRLFYRKSDTKTLLILYFRWHHRSNSSPQCKWRYRRW